MISFGTGGWRAIIGEDFTKENIQILALAMCMKIKAEKKEDLGIAVGYDRRFLSKEAVIWLCEIFGREGIRVYFINRSSPTPLLMYYVMSHDLPYGMMVTASHNPAIYNGIKVCTQGGRDADERQTEDIERYIKMAEAVYLPEEKNRGHMPSKSYLDYVQSGLVVEVNSQNEYIDSILSHIDVETIKKRDLRVALDPMYGVSLTPLSMILAILRCTTETINTKHDTLFGGKMPAPTQDTLKTLQNYVVDRFCDIGIATDGDADRIGLVDDLGNYLSANDILVLLYYYLLKYKKIRGDAVRNIATTHRLDRVAERFGYKVHEVPVGFKYISAKMQETDAVIGGESSGGLTVRGHIHGKDGIYAASLLIEMISVTGKKLSQINRALQDEFGRFVMVEYDYHFIPEWKEIILDRVMGKKELAPMEEIERVSYLDGCKVYFSNGGWVSIRFSGTEPLLRIFCEMKSREKAEAICRSWKNFLLGEE